MASKKKRDFVGVVWGVSVGGCGGRDRSRYRAGPAENPAKGTFFTSQRGKIHPKMAKKAFFSKFLVEKNKKYTPKFSYGFF